MVQDLKRAPEKPSGSCVWNGSLGSSTHESHQEPWARLPKDSTPAGKSTCGFNPGLKERCHPHHGGRGQGWGGRGQGWGGGVRAGGGAGSGLALGAFGGGAGRTLDRSLALIFLSRLTAVSSRAIPFTGCLLRLGYLCGACGRFSLGRTGLNATLWPGQRSAWGGGKPSQCM